jgi:5-formyltetrahydrofolate cyclo-ligase
LNLGSGDLERIAEFQVRGREHMDEIQAAKMQVRNEINQITASLSKGERAKKNKAIEEKLFEFANFLEARIVLLYVNRENEVQTANILAKSFDIRKIVVLPAFNPDKLAIKLFKVDSLERDVRPGPVGILEPDTDRCKVVPIDRIDIAIIPGIAFDEKGGRIGSGEGYYGHLIPKLPVTTRKVALAYEHQIVPAVPSEPHDKPVDIIISDKRIIYKI